MSMVRKWSSTCSTTRAGAAGSLRSAGMTSARPPACSTSAASDCSSASLRAVTAIAAPSAAKPRAIARPMPRLAPVIKAMRPSNFRVAIDSRTDWQQKMRAPLAVKIDSVFRTDNAGRGGCRLSGPRVYVEGWEAAAVYDGAHPVAPPEQVAGRPQIDGELVDFARIEQRRAVIRLAVTRALDPIADQHRA